MCTPNYCGASTTVANVLVTISTGAIDIPEVPTSSQPTGITALPIEPQQVQVIVDPVTNQSSTPPVTRRLTNENSVCPLIGIAIGMIYAVGILLNK